MHDGNCCLTPSMSTDITSLVRQSERDASAMSKLLERVYPDLHRIAARHMKYENRQLTMGATGLVHEAYMRLTEQLRDEQRSIKSRSHFFALATRIMRNLLCDQARTRYAQKRGGREALHEPIDNHSDVAAVDSSEAILAVNSALQELEQVNPRWASVVECKFFGGLSDKETAETLDMSLRSMQRDWNLARQWLAQRLT